MITRRSLLALAAASPTLALSGSAHAEETSKVFRIGWQKNGILALVKRRGALEKRLGEKGIQVSWAEFSSGPPLLEALGSGALEFGATGDVPPIFAQAARGNLVYVAATPAPGSQSAILVRKDSPIQAIADLKGKTLAFVRGSSAHNVAVSVLATAGLTLKDVTVLSLGPADASAAFVSGRLDAWSIWEPYFALAERDPNTRVLTTAAGIVDTYSFFLANGSFARSNSAVLREVIGILAEEADWSQTHLNETTKAISEITGVAEEVTRTSLTRPDAKFQVVPVTEDVIRIQQKTADTFFDAGLIPRKLDIRSIVWTPVAS